MAELWLKFKDEKDKPQRILVDADKFSVGRHPENNLSISNNSLSRKHIQIERFGDIFIVSDCNSSNGTTYNDEDLKDPVALNKDDKLNLGNSLEIEVEIISGEDGEDEPPAANEPPAPKAPSPSAQTPPSNGFSLSFFIIAPLLGLFFLTIAGIGFYVFRSPQEVAKNDDVFVYSDDKPSKTINNTDDDFDDKPTPTPKTDENKQISNSPTSINSNNPSQNSPNSPNSPTPTTSATKTASTPEVIVTTQLPKINEEANKVERNAYSFMRRIAQNDNNPVLTSKQIQILSAKINQLKSSSALRENIKSVRQAKTQIITFAAEKNIKPQFLANAVLTKLGNERGDVTANAQQTREVLDNLAIPVGNALADDCLLMMAAYFDTDNLQMRNMLAEETQKTPASSRQIRTIWFLKDNNKITDAQFEFALRFLAIGTITQNPKDFSVNEEAVLF
jgi:pSer/pThr/pTyr-binding forkhead associated (FHA) protein